MKRLLTSLAVVLLASIAYVTDAQALTLGLVRGEMQCGPTANGKRKGYAHSFRGVLGERTIVLLYEKKYKGGALTYLYGYVSDNKKIYLKGEDMVLSTGQTGNHSFSGRIRGTTIDPNSFPIRLSGPKNSGQWKRECTISITKDTTNKDARDTINSLRSEINILFRANKTLREQKGLSQESKNQIYTLRGEITSLKKLLQKAHQTLQQAQQSAETQSQQTIDGLKTQIAALEAQAKEAKEASSAAAQETLTLSERYAALQQTHKDIQQAAGEAKQEDETVAAKNKQLLADYAVLQEAYDTIGARERELQQENKELSVAVTDLRVEYAALNGEYEASKRHSETLIASLERLISALAKAVGEAYWFSGCWCNAERNLMQPAGCTCTVYLFKARLV